MAVGSFPSHDSAFFISTSTGFADSATACARMAAAVASPFNWIALASAVRMESREVSKDLIAMFDGNVFHTVFSADEYSLPTD